MTDNNAKVSSFAALARTLDDMHKAYAEAMRAERDASSRTTRARNDLNTAQREVDEAVAKLKKSAPVDSDWQREYISREKGQNSPRVNSI